jgi:hypothetical protein
VKKRRETREKGVKKGATKRCEKKARRKGAKKGTKIRLSQTNVSQICKINPWQITALGAVHMELGWPG